MDTEAIKALQSDLNAIIQGKVHRDEASEILRRAYYSDAPELIPALLRVADIVSRDATKRRTAFEALDAAAALGDIKPRLLAYAQSHQENLWLGYYSILVLGRDTDPETVRILTALKDQKPLDTDIFGAISQALGARSFDQRLSRLDNVRDQIEFVLKIFGGGGWNPISGAPEELLERALEPRPYWAMHQFRRLSAEHPIEMAKAVFATDVSSLYYPNDPVLGQRANDSYRNTVARYLTPEARQEFDRLMAEEEARRGVRAAE